MLVRILLVLSVLGALEASKCPDGFKLFERKPTAKNNHTKEWCLGVFTTNEPMGHHQKARSHCISLNSSLSLPENQKEVDFVLANYNETAEDGITIDGEMTKKCEIEQLKTGNKMRETKDVLGECNVKNQLFEFDSANSDPTFIKEHFSKFVPSSTTNHWGSDFKGWYGDFSSCLILKPFENENKTMVYGETAYCTGENLKIEKIVCGRYPL